MNSAGNPNVNIAPSDADGDDTPLHVMDCPYVPFQETFPEPGEERPECTCPNEHLARVWKLRWILAKRRLEELRNTSALVMSRLWELRTNLTPAELVELERLIHAWEDASEETLIHSPDEVEVEGDGA